MDRASSNFNTSTETSLGGEHAIVAGKLCSKAICAPALWRDAAGVRDMRLSRGLAEDVHAVNIFAVRATTP
jgi:hypothetical protein